MIMNPEQFPTYKSLFPVQTTQTTPLVSSKIPPVGYDPTDVALKAMNVKMGLYRLSRSEKITN